MKVLVVFCSVFIIACSNGSSLDSAEICRLYSTNYTSDMGITTSCSFDINETTLSCSNDSSNTNSNIKYYNSVKEFVLESSYIGKTTYSSQVDSFAGGAIFTNNSFENGLHISQYTDTGLAFGVGTFADFQHSEFDKFNRPISAIVTTNINQYCSEQSLSIEYLDQERILRTTFDSTNNEFCELFSGQEITFDENGNIIKNSNIGYIVDYTINQTDSICI